MRDDSDFRTQGWITAPSSMTAGFTPSFTTVNGTSLQLIGSGNSSGLAPGSAGVADIGFFKTGVTVNQAWNSGGFALGLAARFNSGTTVSYGSVGPMSACYDGTKYWAVNSNGGICTSPDLKNWTATLTQPPSVTGILKSHNIVYLGNSMVAVFQGGASSWVSYTTNNGQSWTQTNFVGTYTGANGCYNTGIATGNSTYPHVGVYAGADNGNASAFTGCGVYVGTVGGTLSQVFYSQGVSYYGGFVGIPTVVSGIVLVSVQLVSGGYELVSAIASSSTLNSTSAWSSASFSAQPNAITYNPNSNLWVVATATGISTFPNTGAVGTAVPPSGAQTLTTRYSTVGMNNVFWTGSQLVGVGANGHIIKSPDGITWTEVGGHILPTGSAFNWGASIYANSQYVLFSDSTSGVIATTPDLLTNFTPVYIQDGTEQVNATYSWGSAGIYSATSAPQSGSTWTATNGITLYVSAASGGNRTITFDFTPSTNTGIAPAVSTATTHYYEIVAVKNSATTNSFQISMYIDGNLEGTYASPVTMGTGTSDTTSLLVLSLDRHASFVAYDDMYFNLIDGVNNSGQLGIVNIIARKPTTDVQDQWTAVGSAGSNALSVAESAGSAVTTNYVQANVTGAKDIYSSTNTLPNGYNVMAVAVEGVFTKTSTTQPIVNIGLISNSNEVDSGNVTVTTSSATFVSNIVENDPNGNKAWTPASVLASEITLNKVF
jgi:hypothetical protein